MGQAKDWTGQKFGKLTFIRATDQKNRRNIIWKARCDCGTICQTVPRTTTSCGCLHTIPWTDEQLIAAVANHTHVDDVIVALGYKKPTSSGGGHTRERVVVRIKDLGLDTSHWKRRTPIYKGAEEKPCSKCKKVKPMDDFQWWSKKKGIRRPECKECSHQEYVENIDDQRARGKEYYKRKDKAKQRDLDRIYWAIPKNRERKKANRKKHRATTNAYTRKKRAEDPCFRLRTNIGSTIAHIFAGRKAHKNGSFVKKVGYTMDELKAHIESQFEDWMTWENYGPYDPNRRTWQLDHIKPASDFYYTSMDDEAFKECWALSNLRPLDATQNLLDGVRKTRHKKAA